MTQMVANGSDVKVTVPSRLFSSVLVAKLSKVKKKGVKIYKVYICICIGVYLCELCVFFFTDLWHR